MRKKESFYRDLFINNRAMMLLINPDTSEITDCNLSACSFYGYSYDEMLKLKITDINSLPEKQVINEMNLSQAEQKNTFHFKHRLSTGEIRDVEVHSHPITFDGKRLLSSIIWEMTDPNTGSCQEGIVVYYNDISSRKQMEKSLQSLASIAENSSIEDISQRIIMQRKYSILAADDDPASLTALFTILDNEGYYVKAVNNGEEVLQELEIHSQYNLVILDIMMPKLSGYEVLKRIRERFQLMDIPVLLLTAKTRMEDLKIGFELGANDYIAKPFEALELKARVRTLVQLKESVIGLVATELSFLQAQIKPHFLYNSLNVIIALCNREPLRAKELLYDLSDYLRGCFNFENYDGVTPLSGELSTVRAYISLEIERFKDKLKVEYDIDETINIYVPVLCIQPLVENAIRHGIIKKITGGTLRLSVKSCDEYVVINVQDNGIGIPTENLSKLFYGGVARTGVGLKNIQRRLILHYGQGLEIQSIEGQGTIVVMKIPIKKEVML